MDSIAQEEYRRVCDLFWTKDLRSLHEAYMREDQRLFTARLWDYDDPLSILNQGKDLLEKIDPGILSEDDRVWWYETMWIWHHHAISAAIWKNDRARAQHYAAMALAYQMPDHPNRVTRLLWHLVHDRLEEAKSWTREMIGSDHQVEIELIADYEEMGGFF